MVDYQTGGHSVYDIKYHLIWVTKYRYHVLNGDSAKRMREIIRQCCMSRGVTRGYFCATVGAVNEETIKQYIEGQQVEQDDVFDIKD